MNLKQVLLFAGIGLAACGAIAPLTAFENSLRTAPTGRDVFIAVVQAADNLANNLGELTRKLKDSKAAGGQVYKVPIEDNYKLYRFFLKVMAEKTNRDFQVQYNGDKAAELTAKATKLQEDIQKLNDEISKQSTFSGLFSNKKGDLARLTAEKAQVDSELAGYQQRKAKAEEMLPKINEFIDEFGVASEVKRLGELEDVKSQMAADEEADRKRAKRKSKGLVL